MDLFIYDKKVNKFYVCKNGSSETYLFKDKKEVIQGNKLPLGIVDNLEFEMKELYLNRGDFVVMASDGVSDIDMIGFELLKNKHIQKISDTIVNKGDVVKDDKTVFVIKIC